MAALRGLLAHRGALGGSDLALWLVACLLFAMVAAAGVGEVRSSDVAEASLAAEIDASAELIASLQRRIGLLQQLQSRLAVAHDVDPAVREALAAALARETTPLSAGASESPRGRRPVDDHVVVRGVHLGEDVLSVDVVSIHPKRKQSAKQQEAQASA